jgi:hypothetical protein
LPASCADCLKILEPQPPGTLRACQGLYWDCFTLPESECSSRNCLLFFVYKLPTNALIFISLLFYFAAPMCFDTCVSSSGSSSLPAGLHANRMQWLIRLCVIRCYVSVIWRAGVHRSVCLLCGGLVCTDLSGYALSNILIILD